MRLIDADKLQPDRMTNKGLAISMSQIANAPSFNEWIYRTIPDEGVDCISRQFMLDLGATCIATRDKKGKLIALGAIEQLPPTTPQEPRWIPVSERLPDTDDEVLCWYEYYHWSQEKVLPEYGLGRYLRETSAWFGEVANGKNVRVIAWMPLPKPYKAESEE